MSGKYHAQVTYIDGMRFASKGEARRGQELKLAEQAGAIRNLQFQVRYPLTVAGSVVAYYVADFVYREDKVQIIEDFKGVRTPVYKLKRKLMKAIYGIDIRETSA